MSYDNAHNVTLETLYGNLSGHSTVLPQLDGSGRPVENGCESYSTQYVYSTDGFNLLLSEAEPTGKQISYTYQPNTDLLTSKLVSDGTRIVSREFHSYNEDAVCIQSVIDDGCGSTVDDLTGITMRRIKQITPRATGAGIGLPEMVEERYLDVSTGTERVLSRLVNTYQQDLRLSCQDVYGSDGHLSHRLFWEYDPMGNVIRETDALGRVITRRFDANGNKVFEQGPNPDLTTTFVYDFSNRCISQEQVAADGSKRMTSFRYDTLGNKIAEVDWMGRETTFHYDDFNRLIEKIEPETLQLDGMVRRLSTRQEHDLVGNTVAITDANGNTKRMAYNTRGKVTQIWNADGTQEVFEYHLEGTLKRSVGPNGLVTHYGYDTLGRLILKQLVSSEGQILAQTTATYYGMQLIAEMDGNGVETRYEYDSAGRQTAIEKADCRTEFEYDTLGRKAVVCEWIDPNQARVTRAFYDALGRVIREQIEDQSGHVLKWVDYGYDVAGNQTAKTEETQAGVATTTTQYDSFNRPMRLVDPLGHVSVVEYDDSVKNALGQRVLQIRKTDALGTQKWVTCNALGFPVEEVTKNPLGDTIAKHQLSYDGVGNVICRVDTVFADQQNARQVTNKWTYDTMNRPLGLYEAIGTSDERSTFHTYNAYGQQDRFIAADGLEMRFEYDAFGRLADYEASDSSFHYAYHYDSVGNLLSVDDRIQANQTLRSYDASGRLLQETLANGLNITYSYDGLGRPLMITLPDGSGSTYTYDALYLRVVNRLDSQGTIRYSHHYTRHDAKGNILGATLVGAAGESSYTYDLMSRPIQLSSPGYSETIGEGYDPVGNLISRQITDANGTTHCRYSYDGLYQLATESGVIDHRYQHDSLNNRLKKDETAYQINALNQLLQEGDTLYQYDRRGNLISKDNRFYHYDGLGRLTHIYSEDHSCYYGYDAFNRRIRKTIHHADGSMESMRYLYLGQNEVGAIDDHDILTEFRLLGCGKGAEIGAEVALEVGGRTYATLSDSSGSVVGLIDADTGAFAEGYRYTAFGEQQRFGPAVVENPWRFSSKWLDPETGFIYFGRRYYDPSIGRWITPDPIGFIAGPNLYAYVMNNPLTHFDLYGLMTQSQREKWNAGAKERRAALGDRPIVTHLSWLASLPGRVIEGVGRHLVPIPFVRDVVMASGRFIRGKSFFGCDQCVDRPSYNGVTEGRELSDNQRHSSINGILNSWGMALELFDEISHTNGGQRVHYTYSSTTGGPLDINECIALYLGVYTRAVYKLAENWKHNLAEMDALGCKDGTILHEAHSQGGLVTWRARNLMTDKELKRIHVTTYGSAKLIPKDVFGSVLNLVSKRDLVPILLNPIVYFKARFFGSSNITFLDPAPESGLLEHGWDGVYHREIKARGVTNQERFL